MAKLYIVKFMKTSLSLVVLESLERITFINFARCVKYKLGHLQAMFER